MTAGLINVERKGGRRADEGRAMFEEEERKKKKSSDLLLDFLQVSGG